MKQGDKVLVEAVYVGGDDVGGNCVVDVIGRRLDVHTSAIHPLHDPIPGELRDGWRHFGPDPRDVAFVRKHLIGERVRRYDDVEYTGDMVKLINVPDWCTASPYEIGVLWKHIAIKETRLQEILTEKAPKEAEEPRPWVHDWSTCRATDKNGNEYEFEYLPYSDGESAAWEPETGKCVLVRYRGRTFPNWRDTLEYRYPEQEPGSPAHKLAKATGIPVEELRAAVKELMK